MPGGYDVVTMLRSPVLNTESPGDSEQCVATQHSNVASNNYILQANIILCCVQYISTGKVHPITDHEGPEVEYSSFNLDSRWGGHDPDPFTPGERPGTHCIRDLVGPRAGLDRCGKPRPHRDSIPGPSRP